MLNLSVAMNAIKEAPLLALLLILLSFSGWPVNGSQQQATPEPPAIQVTAPLPGEALQGLVTVTGVTQVEGFQSAEISFGYQSDATNTWFLLQQSAVGASDGDLAQWDTTTISDGVYRLRLQVFRTNGQVLETTLEGLRVRNYSPVETSTPLADVPVIEEVVATPTQTALPDYQPPQQTPVVMPTNPARLTAPDLRASLIGGVGLVVGALLLAGIYAGLKTIFRR